MIFHLLFFRLDHQVLKGTFGISNKLMEGCEIPQQLIGGLSHYIPLRLSSIQAGAGFLPSTVEVDKSTEK